ncbi:protein N-lysine methyltransferase METTL21A [Iris pallida]|uniref:Protein N-lysine methyltransferase METTL21A n=1 Tax=Iris pallida TaxID=29817 RepID=A0AAX6I0E1_IRIPA|nr:protein N-lysine methyltransferase METTL21A [Iris pallida]
MAEIPPPSPRMTMMGWYSSPVEEIEDAAGEIMLLWSLQQPTIRKPNSLVRQSSQTLPLDSCGHSLTILQSPSSMATPGVTGAVMWDSGLVLAKFLEHSADAAALSLPGKRAVELGAGCGLVGCVAALLGAHVVLTDLPDRLRLLRKNVHSNLGGQVRGSARVEELTWGDDVDPDLVAPSHPDLVLGSDVVYSEAAVPDLLCTMKALSREHTTIFLSGELRNEAVLEYFLEAAMEDFLVGHVDQEQWHPDYRSPRVALFVMVKKKKKMEQERELL